MVFVFFCYAPSPGRCAFDGCIVLLTSIVSLCVTVYEPILMQFLPFFQKTSAFQMHYMILISVATRWRHKFSKFAVEIFQNVKLGRRVCTLILRMVTYTLTLSHGSAYTVQLL